MLQNSSHKHNAFKTRPDIILSEVNVSTLGKQDIAKKFSIEKVENEINVLLIILYIIEVYG